MNDNLTPATRDFLDIARDAFLQAVTEGKQGDVGYVGKLFRDMYDKELLQKH